MDSGGFGKALDQVTEAASVEEFADRVDAFDAVVIDADQAAVVRLAKEASTANRFLPGRPRRLAALGQADPLRCRPILAFLPHPIGQAQPRQQTWPSGTVAHPPLAAARRGCRRWLIASCRRGSRLLAVRRCAETVWSLQSAANPEYIQFHLGFANDGMAMIDVAASLPSGGDYFPLTMIGGTGAPRG